MKIREQVPARTFRLSEDNKEYQPQVELMARRFMGVLVHPVPLSEMARWCDLDRHGCKVVADWPANPSGEHPIRPGDILQVGDHSYTIRGVSEHPGCYLEMYVDAA